MTTHSSFTTGDGCEIAYRLDGPEDAPLLVLANSIGTSMQMWDGQIRALGERYRVLRYDFRGHGASEVFPGAYSLDRLGRDAVELVDSLGVEEFTFLGISFGGLVGQWLGIHVPERIERLVLANTSAYLGPAAPWDEQVKGVLAAPDMTATAEAFLGNWFPAQMLADGDERVEPFRADLLALDPHGLAGCMAAIRDADMRRTIGLITAPTLVIVGTEDTVTLPEHGELIAETIPGARLVTLPVVHLSNVQSPGAFEDALFSFLDGPAGAGAGRSSTGRSR